ncbi:MAG TPA: hypothetical protein VMM78_10785 [Thermomicrobiales bacterium]|nr:hypothetical protein [Thermomicrobiales bacterium]
MVARNTAVSPIVVSDDATLSALQSIEQRLHDGYAKIEESRARGRNVSRWEAVWLDLLHEYEDLIDRLAA